MKHLIRYNENSSGDKLYLIQEDTGYALGFKGLYNNLDSFIKDISEEICKDRGATVFGLKYEIGREEDGWDVIMFTWENGGSEKYFYSEYKLNTLE